MSKPRKAEGFLAKLPKVTLTFFPVANDITNKEQQEASSCASSVSIGYSEYC